MNSKYLVRWQRLFLSRQAGRLRPGAARRRIAGCIGLQQRHLRFSPKRRRRWAQPMAACCWSIPRSVTAILDTASCCRRSCMAVPGARAVARSSAGCTACGSITSASPYRDRRQRCRRWRHRRQIRRRNSDCNHTNSAANWRSCGGWQAPGDALVRAGDSRAAHDRHAARRLGLGRAVEGLPAEAGIAHRLRRAAPIRAMATAAPTS